MKTESSNRGHKYSLSLTVMFVLLCAATAWAAQHGLNLYINGKVASSDVRIIDGQPYVPLKAVASALNKTINKKADGYEIIDAGGAGQVANKNTGNQGEEIFSGFYRFTVKRVSTADEYTPRYRTGEPQLPDRGFEKKPGFKFVIVECRIKNGTQSKQNIGFPERDWSNFTLVHTALTDTDEHSYEPFFADLHKDQSGYNTVSANFLPGAAFDFVLIFRVPEDAQPKDLIYTASPWQAIAPTNGGYTQGIAYRKYITDFRVALKP